MVTKRDYDALQVEAARSVMLELTRLLGEYHDDMVVVGGWVPALLIPQDTAPHVGSLDVDLALNHKTLQDPGYTTPFTICSWVKATVETTSNHIGFGVR